jgi:hypothetical protein
MQGDIRLGSGEEAVNWIPWLSYFVGGGLLANVIPHFVSGICGRAFQSPFARPPGVGLSSPVVNVFWGALNAVAAYALILHVGDFDFRRTGDAVALGLGAVVSALLLARYFGRFYAEQGSVRPQL